jgi:hypothetical protein
MTVTVAAIPPLVSGHDCHLLEGAADSGFWFMEWVVLLWFPQQPRRHPFYLRPVAADCSADDPAPGQAA